MLPYFLECFVGCLEVVVAFTGLLCCVVGLPCAAPPSPLLGALRPLPLGVGVILHYFFGASVRPICVGVPVLHGFSVLSLFER